MSSKRVALAKPGERSIVVENDATAGAVFGVNLRWPTGELVRAEDFVAPPSEPGLSVVYWRMLREIPPNVVALADTITTGLYAITADGESATRSIDVADGELTVSRADGVDGNPLLGLADVPDSNEGALVGIQRDTKGRVTGMVDATITGTDGEIEVTNGTAADGPPTISLADVTPTAGGTLQRYGFDAKGRRSEEEAADTDDLVEGSSNLYFTAARVRDTLLTGLSLASSAVISATDSALSAFGKLQAQLALKYDKSGGAIGGNVEIAGTLQVATGGTDAASIGTPANAADATLILHRGGAYVSPSSPMAMLISQQTGAAIRIGLISTTTAPCDFVFGDTDSITRGQIRYRNSDDDFQFSTGAAVRWAMDAAALFPAGDGNYSLGKAGNRTSVIYSQTGTINTSDAREKTAPRDLTETELACAAELARLPSIFQWLHAIEEKGDAARLHCSPTVQSVIAAMEAHGLDPFRYGFVCYDEWHETPEVKDEETGEVTQEHRPAGDRYSLRPCELQFFIARGQEERLRRLEQALGL